MKEYTKQQREDILWDRISRLAGGFSVSSLPFEMTAKERVEEARALAEMSLPPSPAKIAEDAAYAARAEEDRKAEEAKKLAFDRDVSTVNSETSQYYATASHHTSQYWEARARLVAGGFNHFA